MKTIDQKAKAYDEALERAKDCLADGTITNTAKSYIEAIFPELKESEGERIRKFLHHTFTAQYLAQDKLGKWHGEPVSNILAWLEKQKPSDAALEYLKENHSSSEVSDFQAAMNIAVAKAYNQGRADAIKQDPCHTCDHPVLSCSAFPCEKKQGEQKQGEKGNIIQSIYEEYQPIISDAVERTCEEWFQTLKERMQHRSKEWSEEDEKMLKDITECVHACDAYTGTISVNFPNHKKRIDWLESLKDKIQTHSTWKPSGEQIGALRYFITSYLPRYNASTSGWIEFENLQSLYNDLKKLKEE